MGGKVSVAVKERYNKKTYTQVNFRLRNDTDISRDLIEETAKAEGKSLNAWLVDLITERITGKAAEEKTGERKKSVRIKFDPDECLDLSSIEDLEAFARSAGMSPREYATQAIREKMKAQEEGFTEDVERVAIDIC